MAKWSCLLGAMLIWLTTVCHALQPFNLKQEPQTDGTVLVTVGVDDLPTLAGLLQDFDGSLGGEAPDLSVSIYQVGISFRYSASWVTLPARSGTFASLGATDVNETSDGANHAFGFDFSLANPVLLTPNVPLVSFGMTRPTGGDGVLELLSFRVTPIGVLDARDTGFALASLPVIAGAVPEPGTYWLMLLGMWSIAVCQWRSRRRCPPLHSKRPAERFEAVTRI